MSRLDLQRPSDWEVDESRSSRFVGEMPERQLLTELAYGFPRAAEPHHLRLIVFD